MTPSETPNGRPALPRKLRFAIWRSRWWGRIFHVAVPIFVLAFFCWQIPPYPYATINVPQQCDLCCFSPDSTAVLTLERGETQFKAGPIRIWNTDQGTERAVIPGDGEHRAQVTFSPNGRTLVAGSDGDPLELWELDAAGKPVNPKPRVISDRCDELRFSFDSQFLAIRSDLQGPKQEIILWSLKPVAYLGTIEGNISSLVFAPDGNSAATAQSQKLGKGDRIMRWRLRPDYSPTITLSREIPGTRAAFSSDLRMYAACEQLPDGTSQLAVYDMATGSKLKSCPFDKNKHEVEKLSFVANDSMLIAQWEIDLGNSGYIDRARVSSWDLNTTQARIRTFAAQANISPNGRWLAVGDNAGAKLVSTATMNEISRAINPNDSGRTWAVGFGLSMPAPFATAVFSADNKSIVITDLRPAHDAAVFFDVWVPSRLNPFSLEQGDRARIWDVETGRELAVFRNCSQARFSPDCRIVATLDDDERQTIHLWHWPLRWPIGRILAYSALSTLIVFGVFRAMGFAYRRRWREVP